MENFVKAFDDSCKTTSKIITSNLKGENYATMKNLTPEKCKKALKNHFLGIERLGIAPEIKGQEDLVMFAGIDIDGKAKKGNKELTTEEKYLIALNLQKAFWKKYKINALIEQSKSKGFHLFAFFEIPVNRDFIQKILENLVTEVTDRNITNGDIEIFPKGKKGLALNLPYFGLFKDENTINEKFYELKKSCFVEGKNMKAIKNPLERIEASKKTNSATLLFLESLKSYPLCILKAALNWTEGERNSLTMAVAGVLKKIAKVPLDEAINVITEITQFNRDEELSGRIATVESTYENEDIASCSIMKGENKNISLSTIICDSDCKRLKPNISIKAKVRRIQASDEIKGNARKDKIAELIIAELSSMGKFYKAENQYYLFLNNAKKLVCISNESFEIRTLFTKWGLNASEGLYKYVLNEVFVYCLENAQNVEIYKYAYYDPEKFNLYIYNGEKEVLKITPDEISTQENGDDGIMFVELKNYQPFKLVEFNKKINYVSKYLTSKLNVDTCSSLLNADTQRKLAEKWFYSLFFESIMKTKPIFTVIGEKGSGKTTFLRRVGQVLFGSKFDVTSVSNDCKDLDTIITNNYYVVLDNLDNPTKNLNDALARIATGQAIKKRIYYTTNDEIEYDVKCFVALTSRTPQFTRDDVADRLVCIYLERYDIFQDESHLKKEAMAGRDEIMSYVIHQLQKIISKLYKNKDACITVSFRMADFAVFALKTAKDKNEIEELKKIFSTMIKIQNEFTLRDDVLYVILKEFVAIVENQGMRFTSAQLYEKFIQIAATNSLLRPFQQVYKNPKAISTRLKNIKNNLSDEIIITTQKGHANVTYYSFSFVDKNKYQDLI